MTALDLDLINTSLVVSSPPQTQLVVNLGSPLTLEIAPVGASLSVEVVKSGVLTAAAPQGPSGPAGPMGASFSGFGYIQYTALTSSPILNLAPGVRTPLVMAIDPAQTSTTLKGLFSNFSFWDGSTLYARAVGDLYEIRFTLTATSAVAGGTLTTEVTINGLTVATDNDSEALSYPAGQPQRVGFKLRLLPKAGFVSEGAQIFLTSTVPVAIASEVLVVDPTNAGS